MTWYEIYLHVCLKLWGSSNPPVAAARLIGPTGMIARAHRDIQRDWNYWFMETETTIPVLAGTSAYALPAGYKELIPGGLQAYDAVSLCYRDVIPPLYPGEAWENYRDPINGASFPSFYEIFGGNIVFYPLPSAAYTVRMRYYEYLDRPTVGDFVAGVTSSDALTLGCPLAVAALAAMEMAGIQKEMDVVQICMAEAKDEVELLRAEDQKYRRPEVLRTRYVDL
jgi:hypothetical protein